MGKNKTTRQTLTQRDMDTDADVDEFAFEYDNRYLAAARGSEPGPERPLTTTLRIKQITMSDLPPTSRGYLNRDASGKLMEDGVKYAVIGKPGCFRPHEPTLMADGSSRRAADVCAGDMLMGPRGLPVEVHEVRGGTSLFVSVEVVDAHTNAVVATFDVTVDHKLVLNEQGDTMRAGDCAVGKFIPAVSYIRDRHLVQRVASEPGKLGRYSGWTLVDALGDDPLSNTHAMKCGLVTHNSGKSGIIKNYMFAKSDLIPVAKVVSGTEEISGFYKPHMPRGGKYVEYEFSKPALKKFIQRQKYATQYLSDPRGLIVLDDVFSNPANLKCKEYRDILKNGRHYFLYHLVGMQYCMDIEPGLRMCFDGAFICREQNKVVLRKLWENFGSVIPEFKLFQWIMSLVAKDYRALFIDNRRPMEDWKECIYWYKGADPVDLHFKFGSSRFHEE